MAKAKRIVKSAPRIKVKKNALSEAELITGAAVAAMQDKKGIDIVTLDLRNLQNRVADYFIICHGESNTHTEGISRFVEEAIDKKLGINPWHREGFENREWILLDYITVVVHVFQAEQRVFYGLERLWADAEVFRAAGNY